MRNALLVGLLLAGLTLGSIAAEPAADPLPLRRIVLPPERIAAELERVRQGILLKMPREEFEAHVTRAAQAEEALRQPPRLLEARYRASLAEHALLGQARWTVSNPAATAVLFPLTSFNLALRRAQLDHADAVLGDLDGKSLAVLLEPRGPQTVALEWSARGDVRPGGTFFSLRMPPCTVQSLELELPEDRLVAVLRESGLLTGPEPAEMAGKRLWRLDCGGKALVELVVRPVPRAEETPLVLARLHTEHQLTPGATEAETTLHLDVARGAVREIRCHCEPGLEPYRVTAREHEVESWDLLRAGPDGPATLTVRLRERVLAPAVVALTVRGLVRTTSVKETSKEGGKSILWTCPGLRPLDAVPRGETLILRVPPDVQLADWRPGRFTLAQSVAEADGRQVLTLHGAGAEVPSPKPSKPKTPETAEPARPRARLRVQEPLVRSHQQVWWQVGAGDQLLTARIAYQVTQGKLHRLQVQLPAWTVELVEMYGQADEEALTSADLIRTWTVLPSEGDSTTLQVDLHRALGPTVTAVLTVRLRQTPTRGGGLPAGLSFPQVVPRGVRFPEGTLAISVAPVHRATALASEPELPPVVAPANTDAAPPWGREPPDFLYAFQGQPVTGALTLRLRPTQVQAQCRSQIHIGGDRLRAVVEVRVQPLGSQPQALDIWWSSPLKRLAVWETVTGANQVRSFERVGDAGGFQLVRLHLAQPLREPLTLRTTLDLGPDPFTPHTAASLAGLTGTSAVTAAGIAAESVSDPSEPRWRVPLPVVLSAERIEGEVALSRIGEAPVEVETKGLTRSPAIILPAGPPPWRSYRYDQASIRLTVREHVAGAEQETRATAEYARVTTTVQPGGELLHTFTCRLRDWREPAVPVFLPVTAQVRVVRANGRWVSTVAPVASADGQVVLNVPVPTDSAATALEIVYATPYTPGVLGARLEVPMPILPVMPLTVRRTWRLPPELHPLREGQYTRVPGTGSVTTLHGLPGQFAGTDMVGPEAWFLTPGAGVGDPPWLRQQGQEFAEAVRRGADARPGTLGELLHAIVSTASEGSDPLVLDVRAWRAAGLGPASELRLEPAARGQAASLFPWASLGISYLPCPGARLLTTRRQAVVWRGQAAQGSEALERALAEAAQFGQDASGRFRRAQEWLKEPGEDALPSRLAAGDGGDWSEWEPLADDATTDTLLVVRREVLPGFAAALTVSVLAGAWGVRRWPARRRFGLLLSVLTVGLLGVLWLPPGLRLVAFWPTAAGLLAAGLWYLRTLLAPTVAPALGSASALAAAVGVLLALTATLSGQGEGTPATVWLLPESGGGRDKGSVLVSPDLWQQLRTLARRGVAGLSGAVLLGADYTGQVEGATAAFTAEYTLWCFEAEEAADLTLPLAGVEPSEVLLDGAPAFPTAVAAPQTGYTLKVKDQGRHTLRVRFTARVQGENSNQELRFTIPRLARNHVQVNLRQPAAHVQALVGPQGGLRQTKPDGAGWRVEADLGRTTNFLIRWRAEPGPARPAQVEVREAYLWDLRGTGHRLHGVLQYQVRPGAITALSLELPPALEVTRVEAGPVPPRTLAPRLTGWRVDQDGRTRRLRLEFLSPITEAVQVEVEMVPVRPPGPEVSLALPIPEHITRGDGVLAVSADGTDVGIAEHLRLTAVDRETFLEAWKATGLADPGPLLFRYRFRRGPESGPVLKVRLTAGPSQLQAIQGLTWHLGPRQAEVRATARVVAGTEELVLVEWEVPQGLQIADVRGEHVRGWVPVAGKIQVWLQRRQRDMPLMETTVELVGWLPRSAKDAAFTVPRLRVTAPRQTTHLRVTAPDGWVLEPTALRGFLPLPESRPSPRDYQYVTREDNPAVAFRVRPEAAVPEIRMLTLLEARENLLHFHTTIELQPRQGEPRRLVLRLRNWDGVDVKCTTVPRAEVTAFGRAPDARGWLLDLPSGLTAACQVRLSGSRPLDSAALLPVPDVTIPGLPAERWLAVAGAELQAEAVRGLKTVPDHDKALQPWAGVRDRVRRAGGTAWQVEAADWQLRLRRRQGAGTTAAVRVLWAEHTAARTEGGRWLHDSTYWLQQDEAAQAAIHFPARAALLAGTLDGADLSLTLTELAPVLVDLPARSGVRVLRLRWRLAVDATGRDELPLTPPRLDSAADYANFWTVLAPAGSTLHSSGEGVTPSSVAAASLYRAHAWFQLSVQLARPGRTELPSTAPRELRTAQEQFYRECQRAAALLTGSPGQAGAGPKGESLAEWLRALRDQNRQLAQANQFEPQRAEAEKQAARFSPDRTRAEDDNGARFTHPPDSLLTARGVPSYWLVRPDRAEFLARLTAARSDTAGQGIWWSLLLLGIALAAWRLQDVPWLWEGLYHLWPEQVAGLGLAAWLTVGVPILAAGLVVVGIVARLYLLGRGLRTLLTRQPTAHQGTRV